ncbi:MAG: endo-1,4-beta-xylanase [Clostridia bacterium]|nr:endo-1,4-beta-xylanase [Clostridia bacterium]
MKKLTAILLILALGLGAWAALAENDLPYQADFSAGTDGFYARSTGGAQLTVADGVLSITGRSDSWHSPGRDFQLEKGKEYYVSAELWQESGANANMVLSIAHKDASGKETYERITSGYVPSGKWTELSGKFKAGDYASNTLYVETVRAAEMDFSMKNFTITEVAPPAPTATPMPPITAQEGPLPALKEVYSELFDLGCAVNEWDAANKSRMTFYGSQFNIMTHENALKPDSVFDLNASRKLVKDDPTAVAVNFNKASSLLNYCQANGIKVHGHVLVWHNQTPEAFFHEDYVASKPYVSREVMLGRLENYIKAVLTGLEAKYPGLIVSWDVVNEAVADGSSALRKSNWTKVVGEDFINHAFAYARKYAPEGTLLFYNDYSTPYEPKLTGICNLLDSLKADGNIDGYGFQCHFQLNSPSLPQLRSAFQRIADKGLLLRVSELDITISDTLETTLQRQARRYQDLFGIFNEFSEQLIAVQVWGVTDDRSWKSGEHPLLFDKSMQPKPAFWGLVDPSQLPQQETADEAPASLPVAKAVYGLEALDTAEKIPMKATLSADAFEGGKVSAYGQAAWDEKNLYVKVTVTDPWLNASSPNAYEQDSVELFVDEGNERGFAYDGNDHHYRVNYLGDLSIDAGFQTVSAQAERTGSGFTALFTMPFTQEVKVGSELGFDLRYNNAGPDGVRRLMNFCDASDTGWNDPSVFGILKLEH